MNDNEATDLTTNIDQAVTETFLAIDPPSQQQAQEKVNCAQPPQHQSKQPGDEAAMAPKPESFMRNYKPAGKLAGKVALISGGDSGIGRAVAIGYAKEGADVAIIYLDEESDAQETLGCIEAEGRRGVLIRGDIGSKKKFVSKP